MSIKENLEQLREELPKDVQLIAVSKYHTVEEVMEAYDAGQRIFGENRVQEMEEKQPQLPDDIEWHLIGTLQRNKVKYIIPYVHTIHSVDSEKLLNEIEKQCARRGREKVRALLQLHISGEETKHGFSREELQALLDGDTLKSLQHVEVVGIMGMGSLTNDQSIVEGEFARMQEIFKELKEGPFSGQESFKELSMGMSQDYQIALSYGTTYVRLGTAIFGQPNRRQ
ncbi:YggS family pyridoxal phosphate-dependent enzyme [Porphyromonadaceae bacterium W3.11]|nr:YggS family pyridoxal phosphate-dependent enzyme [Porphyromonadaceae bacterium W3.11]